MNSINSEGGESFVEKTRLWWKTLLRFLGPGYLVAVGYLDPGNWATDLAAGSQFGYSLLFVILFANLMAVLLQWLCIKLGVVTGRDLAQSCRKHLPPGLNFAFYLLCELAIMACDLAEVIGTAIALNLLIGLPLAWGVAFTGLDVLVILAGWNPRHLRTFEFVVIGLIVVVAACFVVLLVKSRPDWLEVAWGFVPSSGVVRDGNALYVAMGIVGATVMPHNLYLHSHIVKFRSSKNQDKL
ncbi:hypothetical protein HK102_010185, partial [Quaeritorhiza haematococci]